MRESLAARRWPANRRGDGTVIGVGGARRLRPWTARRQITGWRGCLVDRWVA
jgi:hypothetical protein